MTRPPLDLEAIRQRLNRWCQCPEDSGMGHCVLARWHDGDHAIEGSIPYDEMQRRLEAELDAAWARVDYLTKAATS